MTVERWGRIYGGGQLVGDYPKGRYFLDLTDQGKAVELGWSNGCPVTHTLVETRGAREMALRYGIVNFWGGYIVERVRKVHPEWADILEGPIARLPDEPLGNHDKQSVPRELKSHMFGLGGPYGFALPRMLIEYLKADRDKGIKQDKLLRVDDALSEAFHSSSSLTNFTVTFANRLARNMKHLHNENPTLILKHLLGTGKLDEDNCRGAYRDIYQTMQDGADFLAITYNRLSPDERDKLHIASPEDFL